MLIQPNDLVLFQGDSITDCARVRDQQDPQDSYRMGHGYALMAAGMLGVLRPGTGLRFENRGISGEGVRELAARWQADCLDLRPTVLSLLIGVNDEWRGVAGKIWELEYRGLLIRTRNELPGIRFVLCEPFLLPNFVQYAEWAPGVAERSRIVRALAAEYEAAFVPCQDVLDAAVTADVPAAYWAWDGVHPTTAGHMLLAQAWLAAVER
jgi:acyl-CoA thioesterase-1